MTLKGHYALYLKTHASFRAHHENVNEDRPIRRCSPMTLASGNIRFMRIFAGVLWRGSVKRQWGNRKRRFQGFRAQVFGTLGNEAKIKLGLRPPAVGDTALPLYSLGLLSLFFFRRLTAEVAWPRSSSNFATWSVVTRFI